ncbi:Polyketide cyclase / dehydrase and lipid transport [compost metagenome]
MQSPRVTQQPEARVEPATTAPLSWRAALEDGRLWRAGAILLGGALLTGGLRRRSFGGLVVAIAGEELIRQGVSGKSYLFQAVSERLKPGEVVEIASAVTIARSADEVYRCWRKPGTMQQVLGEVVTVTELDGDRAHWRLNGPLDTRLEWDMVLAEDVPGERVRWTSAPEARVPVEALVEFRTAPANRGTEVLLRLAMAPPGAAIAQQVVKVLGVVPSAIEGKVLRRFKSLVETGEIPTTRRQPACRGAGRDA